MRRARRIAAALEAKVTDVRRARRTVRVSRPPAPDADVNRRLEALEARSERLEAALEDVQDALYRHALREDETRAELRERTAPERIARELSADARRRGL
jgi:hypothetical protein